MWVLVLETGDWRSASPVQPSATREGPATSGRCWPALWLLRARGCTLHPTPQARGIGPAHVASARTVKHRPALQSASSAGLR